MAIHHPVRLLEPGNFIKTVAPIAPPFTQRRGTPYSFLFSMILISKVLACSKHRTESLSRITLISAVWNLPCWQSETFAVAGITNYFINKWCRYSLCLKDRSTLIEINILKGQRVEDYLLFDSCAVETARNYVPIQIANIQAEDDSLNIRWHLFGCNWTSRLSHYNECTRVHIYASAFIPV